MRADAQEVCEGLRSAAAFITSLLPVSPASTSNARADAEGLGPAHDAAERAAGGGGDCPGPAGPRVLATTLLQQRLLTVCVCMCVHARA